MDKDEYYLDIAKSVSQKSTCIRRHFGAIIVKNDEIISTGYNGAPRGRRNCTSMDKCVRDKLNIPHGQRYEICRSVHAEQNAIISAARRDMIDSTLYLVGVDPKTNEVVEGFPCNMCERFIVNSGIKNIVVYCTLDTILKFQAESDESIKKYKELQPEKFKDLKIKSFDVDNVFIKHDNSLEGESNYK